MDSLGFEGALIGTVLVNPERMNDLDATVLPSDFSAISHQVMWEKITPLATGGQLSKVAIVETLRAVGLLENLGQDIGNEVGAAYIDKLCEMASPQSIAYYADQVIGASIKRQMGQSIALTKIDLDEDKQADEILDAAEGRLWEMRRQKSPNGAEIADLLDILDVTIDDYRSGEREPAYTIKNSDLGRIIGFLEGQDYSDLCDHAMMPMDYIDPYLIGSQGHDWTWIPQAIRDLEPNDDHHIWLAGGCAGECLADMEAILNHYDATYTTKATYS